MRDHEPSRPRRKRARAARSRGDGNPVPMWARVGAFALAIIGLIGVIVKFVERRDKPNPAPSAAVTPAQPAPRRPA